jgi:hypothetical protein
MSAIRTSLASSRRPIRSGFVGTAATPGSSRASYLGKVREGRHSGLRSREFAAGADLQRWNDRARHGFQREPDLWRARKQPSSRPVRRQLLSPLWSVRPVRLCRAVRPAMMRRWRIAAAGLGEMRDEVPGELRKPHRPLWARPGCVAGGEASRCGYCGIASSDPSLDTLYRTAAGSHPVVPVAQAI